MASRRVDPADEMLSAADVAMLLGISAPTVHEIPPADLAYHLTAPERSVPVRGSDERMLVEVRRYRRGDVLAYRDARRVGGPPAAGENVVPIRRGDA